MSVPRTVLAAGSLVAALATAGCSAGVTNSSAPSSAAPTAAASSGTAATPGQTGIVVPSVVVPSVTVSGLPGGGTGSPGSGGATGGGGGTAGTLPAGFPLPPGTTVGRVVDDGGEIAATLTVPDAARAASFWKSALPGAGYAVTSAQTAGGFGEIRFSGHGCGGDSQLAIQGTTVALQCDRG